MENVCTIDWCCERPGFWFICALSTVVIICKDCIERNGFSPFLTICGQSGHETDLLGGFAFYCTFAIQTIHTRGTLDCESSSTGLTRGTLRTFWTTWTSSFRHWSRSTIQTRSTGLTRLSCATRFTSWTFFTSQTWWTHKTSWSDGTFFTLGTSKTIFSRNAIFTWNTISTRSTFLASFSRYTTFTCFSLFSGYTIFTRKTVETGFSLDSCTTLRTRFSLGTLLTGHTLWTSQTNLTIISSFTT